MQAVLKKKTVEKKQVFDDNNKRSNKHEMQQDALQRKFQQITLSGTSIVRCASRAHVATGCDPL